MLGISGGDEGDQKKDPATGKGFVGRLTSMFSRQPSQQNTAKPPPPSSPTRRTRQASPGPSSQDKGVAHLGTTTEVTSPPTDGTATATSGGPTPLGNKSPHLASRESQAVDPEIKVLPFEVREPSLQAAVVGQVVVLDGSCYVWAAVEGASSQGSLAAAVGTRFDGGMPTVTALLAGEGAPGTGGDSSGGLGASMAQRLCKRTGRVVFVSCDLPEDSQLLVAAVEAKVVSLLTMEP